MDFRCKCLLQSIMGVLPHSEELNYFAQKHVTKTLPPSRAHYEEKKTQALSHHRIFSKYGGNGSATVYEIGCGWTCAMALILSTFSGGGHYDIKAVDVKAHVRVELINRIIDYLREDGKVPQDFQAYTRFDDIREKLHDDFKIDYLAPCDSARTGLETGSIDFVYSQEVFEHIHPDALAGVVKECHRLMKVGGIASIYINYADHYCSIDKKVTPYSFLQYPSDRWRLYNPDLHYVNRLRHVDFIKLFEKSHFRILDTVTFRPDNFEETMAKIPFAKEFSSKYSLDELSITSANIVLQKV